MQFSSQRVFLAVWVWKKAVLKHRGYTNSPYFCYTRSRRGRAMPRRRPVRVRGAQTDILLAERLAPTAKI